MRAALYALLDDAQNLVSTNDVSNRVHVAANRSYGRKYICKTCVGGFCVYRHLSILFGTLVALAASCQVLGLAGFSV